MSDEDKVLDKHIATIRTIKETQYYTEMFESVLVDWHHDWDSVEQMTILEDICSFWNDFWRALPDLGAIHRNKVFYSVCDLAEGDYLPYLDLDETDSDNSAG